MRTPPLHGQMPASKAKAGPSERVAPALLHAKCIKNEYCVPGKKRTVQAAAGKISPRKEKMVVRLCKQLKVFFDEKQIIVKKA